MLTGNLCFVTFLIATGYDENKTSSDTRALKKTERKRGVLYCGIF